MEGSRRCRSCWDAGERWRPSIRVGRTGIIEDRCAAPKAGGPVYEAVRVGMADGHATVPEFAVDAVAFAEHPWKRRLRHARSPAYAGSPLTTAWPALR